MDSPKFVTDGHLGGYIEGGDAATQYPDLWRWLVGVQGVKRVLDVGCGDGQAVEFFRKLGIEAWGVDGVEQDSPWISQHDFTQGPMVADAAFDLVWSCEFVEHVEEQYTPYFLAAFRLAPLVLMTHAHPEQHGWHHVNCQGDAYWLTLMDEAGFDFDYDMTRDSRALASANIDPHNHYIRSGLAFRRR